MKLIDADKLQKDFVETHDGKRLLLIDLAPTVDAVPVVRCKDCVHFGETENPCFNLCHYGCDEHMIDVSPDWFCADGERRC